MAPEQLDGFSLAFPLLHDESQNVEDMEYSSTGCKLDLGSISFFKTCFNGLNALLGIGILSVPYALASGGWLSLMLLFVIALATFYTGLLLQRCMDVDLNIRTYPDIGEQAFGKKGRLMVSIFMYLELYLVATGFLILEGDNLHNLFPMVGFEIFGQVIDGRQSFILISGLVILPSVCFYNLNMLSYISASGVFASITILGSILWTGVFDGVGFQGKGTTLNWKGIPTAFSLACAAMAVLGYLKFGSFGASEEAVARLEMELTKILKEIDSLKSQHSYLEKQLDSLKAASKPRKDELNRLEALELQSKIENAGGED
ncbi:Amino acid transporter AVT1I [Vitis vinifera]|uniref:Amino acid transporter AVT1I n=1 Tax=Vitis vinifera TaxID=29760 RepID=A0A438HE13_VITVI|nr:Amino acid transporter AVT1I [Vitis vinifera]